MTSLPVTPALPSLNWSQRGNSGRKVSVCVLTSADGVSSRSARKPRTSPCLRLQVHRQAPRFCTDEDPKCCSSGPQTVEELLFPDCPPSEQLFLVLLAVIATMTH
ncbi:hypothetical protein CgunFtcFv8_006005 [Champsocephalus gunnari]|uniref:Uncharacterized protein n=1 Tax=Champsocephalus gunnari TaxID=52237 RepID=A0AAN8BWD3_CHAGU|nr:hypothetical protein CgunFtcFv8_006005 [Champsocephalus gunnari]